MWRSILSTAVVVAMFAGGASAETLELRCRQEISEVYSMGRTGMVSYEATEPLDVVISLDTDANTATLDRNAGMFDVGDGQVLVMMVSEQLREVWDIDRATGRAMVMGYLIDEPRTVFIRREAQCELPDGMSL